MKCDACKATYDEVLLVKDPATGAHRHLCEFCLRQLPSTLEVFAPDAA